MRIRLLLALCFISLLGILAVARSGIALAGSGWVAKRTCSGVFIAGRAAESLVEASLPLPIPIPIPAEVDREEKTVTAFFANLMTPSTARYRPGIGCTLVDEGETPSPLDSIDPDRFASERNVTPLPDGSANEWLLTIVEESFAPGPGMVEQGHGTRALVVLQDGRVLAERYAPGFTRQTPLPGWSMTKSITSTIVGMLADADRLDRDSPIGLEEWSSPHDPRRAITWDHLLRMSSGLSFEEDYTLPTSDAIQMLFGLERFSKGRYAASLPLEYAVDTHWSYSSGTTNLIQYALLERVFGDDLEAYLTFPREALFDRIGMSSAVLEPDGSGAFVGSSFMFATARDWARYGLLYLNDGVWEGERILSPDWIRYSAAPTATNAGGFYGAHWWLNSDPPVGDRRMPLLDPNIMIASGFEGQSVVVVPNHDLVVVRLGLDRGDRFDIESFVAQVVTAASNAKSQAP